MIIKKNTIAGEKTKRKKNTCSKFDSSNMNDLMLPYEFGNAKMEP